LVWHSAKGRKYAGFKKGPGNHLPVPERPAFRRIRHPNMPGAGEGEKGQSTVGKCGYSLLRKDIGGVSR